MIWFEKWALFLDSDNSISYVGCAMKKSFLQLFRRKVKLKKLEYLFE